jgi:ankyrin repeat protein
VGGDGFGFRAFWRDGTQNNLTVVDTPMETWFHYAATYDGREMRLYINGVPAGRTFTVDKTFASSTAETWIGGVGTSTGEAFYGYLDDVGIWSRALSEEELKQVISGGPNRNDKTLSAWHSFEEECSSADELRASDIPSPTLEQAAAAGLDDHLKANAVGYGSDSTKVDRLFWWAVNHAHIRAAEILVSQGADVNARLGWGGHTALHAAVRDRRIEVIQFLIGQAANVNALDATYGSTPWEWAERFEYPILRSYLLDTAAESNVYAAVEHDTPDHVENLLKQPEPWDLNAVLRKAAQLGRPEILELLINAGADPKHVKDGTTPHDLAVLNSRYECVDILRRAEGRADSTDTDYIDLVQMLEEAIVQGQVREIARLVAVDPDLVRSDPQADRTWLQLAVEAGNAEVTRLLIHSGASLERVRNGHTALSWAATRGELSVGRLLVDSGAVVDLFTAAGLGDLGYVRDLFDGDVPALESSTGSTRFDNDRTPLPKPPVSSQDQISDALYVAARNGHANVVVYLLNKGGDPNFRAARGGTAVYWAVHSADIRTIEVLVKAGGDPSIPDRYGRNALQVAARSGYSEVKKLLGIKE